MMEEPDYYILQLDVVRVEKYFLGRRLTDEN